MNPFKAQCNEIARREFHRTKYNKKRDMVLPYTVSAKLCEEQIWFQPSLKPGVAVGHCTNPKHNPVYRKVND